MITLVLSITNESALSRMKATAILMGAEVHCVDLCKPGQWKPRLDAWYLLDHDLPQLKEILVWLSSNGVNIERRVVRLIEEAWLSYWYHDLPVFASLVTPKDPLAASEVLNRLSQVEPIELETASPSTAHDPFADRFVQSEAMSRTMLTLKRLVGLPIDTVILGPTGAGKDTVAQWLHDQSGVSGEFVHLNCAALPDQLFESELFGVKAGAYTGATQDRDGKLFQANGGTLYLDELDSLPLTSQAKLLTALQYRGAVPLGGNKFIQSEFRLLVSTKVDLADLVRKGKFREDLLYRLNISIVQVPALNQRLEDIIPVYCHFLEESALTYRRPVPELTPTDEQALLEHDWPGNVRELRAHAVRRVVGLGADDLGDSEVSTDLKSAVERYERALLSRCLIRHRGNIRVCAEELGIRPQSLYYRLKCLGLSPGVAATSCPG